MKRLEALSDKPVIARHRANTPSLEGWLHTTMPQPWLITSTLLQVKQNTFNNKFHIALKELSKYLRNQCKTTPCDIIPQVLDAHSQAE